MEEEKRNEAKQPKQQRYTYEELLEIAGGLQQTNKQLMHEIDGMRAYISEQQMQGTFAFLGACDKVIGNAELFDSEFVMTVIGDYKKTMLALRHLFVPEEQAERNEENDGDDTEE